MNLSKLPNEEKLALCRWNFLAGCAFLPFLWLINAVWFFKEAFRKEQYPQQNRIKTYVILSGIGTTLWMIALVTWTIIYQTHRASWGEFGEELTLLIPTGIP